MSSLRERLVRNARAERAPPKTRARVLRTAASAAGVGLLAGFWKVGVALAVVGVLSVGVGVHRVYDARSGEGAPSPAAAPAALVVRGHSPAPAASPSPAASLSPAGSPLADRPASPSVLAPRAAEVPRPAPSSRPAGTGSAPPRALLSEEVALLDQARAQIAAGEGAAATATLARFRREVPRPMLGDEAAALEVEALARAGAREAAKSRLAAFRAARPESPYLARLARLLEGEGSAQATAPSATSSR